VAVRNRALNLEGIGRGDDGFPFEEAAEGIDLRGGPSGEIGEGALDDFAVDTGGFAEENGGRGVAVGYGLYVHGNIITKIINEYKYNNSFTWVHAYTEKWTSRRPTVKE
jgi:hypothetical protein